MGQKEIDKVSEILNAKNIEVQNMESRLTGGDLYLNQKIDNESENDLMSLINDDRPNPEETFDLQHQPQDWSCSPRISGELKQGRRCFHGIPIFLL